MARDLNGVPPGAEVWRNSDTGAVYVMYETPEVDLDGDGQPDPPVPMVWHVTSTEQLEALFGPGQPVEYDRQMTQEQWDQVGAVGMGVRSEIVNEDTHPFEVMVGDYEARIETQPWLADPEVFALASAAVMEGGQVSRDELLGTEWFKTRTDAEVDWAHLKLSRPAEAEERLAIQRGKVRDRLIEMGYQPQGEDDEVIRYIADKVTTGQWDPDFATRQMQAVVDPEYQGADLLPYLGKRISDREAQTRAGESEVRQLLTKWLGPHGNWNDSAVKHWAGRLRNDPDAQDELTDLLKKQRLALYPEYENENLTYQDIAQPWVNQMEQAWGRTVHEEDPLLQRIINLNDSEEAARMLRKEGLKQGVEKVVKETAESMTQAFGGNVRRSA